MIIHAHQKTHHSLLGGKASALAKLASTSLHIPEWCVVADYCEDDLADIQRFISETNASLFAVRSSAKGEDGIEHSFAGQYDTFLNVTADKVIEKIQRVQSSATSEHLQIYQSSKSIKQTERPSVIVQRMLAPSVSGVAFSADPVSGNLDSVVISATWGLGSALVSGEVDADAWTLDKDDSVLTKTIADKAQHHIPCQSSDEGVRLSQTDDASRLTPCLTTEQLTQIANLVRECARFFDCPQDIEWAIENDELYLLQSRPITTLPYYPDQTLPVTVWDNSNIAESYSGLTSTLTFSFAERAYEHVYREFCKVLSVPASRIAGSDAVFSSMLGHIHGHVYYNLNSWYHVLALLPGFSVNRGFMEQMMGVKEPMPREVVDAVLTKTSVSKIQDSWALVKTVIGLIRNHRSLNKQIEGFYRRLNSALTSPAVPLVEMSGDQLVSHYRDLEAQLLKRWDAPLINDFFAMIYYGVLGSLCEKWLGDASLQNTLLLDSGEIISAEPPRRIKQMAELIYEDQAISDTLADPSAPTARKLELVESHAALSDAYHSYLEKFGDRCLEELKLESPTVSDEPQSLLTGIGGMAKRLRSGKVIENSSFTKPPEIDLTGIKKKLFNWVLSQTKNRVRDRENLRFERTRLFGRVRQIVLQLGQRLAKSGRIPTSHDVFYLTISELMGVYEGTQAAASLKNLIAERKSDESTFKIPPPDRFETRGDISRYSVFQPTTAASTVYDSSDGISGTAACPGVVRGYARVVLDPRGATLLEGEILVAQQTDPGWVVLFPAASGLLVERGSLLSHSAIVARELQLPCVVSIPQVTTRIKTGDLIEMNGSTGQIHILEQN